jgi:tetratricopeptide (TPR) repeat protein
MPSMKRSCVLLTGAIVAALSLGCANSNNDQKKNDDKAMAKAAEKYQILNGSTASQQAKEQDAEVAPEPALSADSRFAAGMVAESQGKIDCAIIQYQQALRLNPNHVPSLYRMGVVQTKSKSYDKAVETWKQYVKATGDIASSWANLGFCYEMAGDIENAETAYKEGLNRDAKSQPCRVNYGLMLARQNRQSEAELQLSSCLKPDEVAYNLAAVYEQQGAIAQAKESLKKALQANPNNADAQAKLASLPQD